MLMEPTNECRNPYFVAPKKPYSFTAMLDDILNFASDTLVDNGRISFWMPTANDEEQEIPMPSHPCLSIVVVCTQVFNKCMFAIYHESAFIRRLTHSDCQGHED